MTPRELQIALATLGWKQRDAARETGYRQSEISRMCTGKREVPIVLEKYLKLRLRSEADGK